MLIVEGLALTLALLGFLAAAACDDMSRPKKVRRSDARRPVAEASARVAEAPSRMAAE